MTIINIERLDKVTLLKSLCDLALKKRMNNNTIITLEDARQALEHSDYIAHINGVSIQCNFSGNTMDISLYNQTYGRESAEGIINNLRLQNKVTNDHIIGLSFVIDNLAAGDSGMMYDLQNLGRNTGFSTTDSPRTDSSNEDTIMGVINALLE